MRAMKKLIKSIFLFTVFYFPIVFYSCTEDKERFPEDVYYADSAAVLLTDSSVVIEGENLVNPSTGGPGVGWDESSGIISMTKSSAKSAGYFFSVNDIVACDLGTSGILRRITDIDSTSTLYIVYTEEADFLDFFREFKASLTTQISTIKLANANLSNKQISAALTDNSGKVHPYKIVRKDENGNIVGIWSAFQPMLNIDEAVFSVNWDYSESSVFGDSSIKESPYMYIKKGYADVYDTIDINVDIKQADVSKNGINTYVNSFSCKNNSYMNLYNEFIMEAGNSFSKTGTGKLADIYSADYCFMVGPVPVWVSVNAHMLYRYTATSGGNTKISAGIGYKVDNGCFGVSYTRKNGWSPVHSFSGTSTRKLPEFSGSANLFGKLEIYPQINVDFFSSAGTYTDVIPYLEARSDFSDDFVTGTGLDSYWNSVLNSGLNLRLGADAKVLGSFVSGYNAGEKTLAAPVTVYHAPDKVEIHDGNNQSGTRGQSLNKEIQVRVLDSWGNPVVLAPVYFEPYSYLNGSVSSLLEYTDGNGLCGTKWTLGPSAGVQKVKASVKINDDITIDHVTFSSTAN